MSEPLDPGHLHRLPPWPLLLAGPIVRRVDSGSAAVFVATSQAVPTITLTVFDGAEESAAALAPQIPGKAATLALGANLHVCVVQATGLALEPGRLYGYDLQFATANGVLDLAALGLLADPVPLGYIPGCRPAFVLPGSLAALRIVHTSCRKFHGARSPAYNDPDAMPILDQLIQERRADAESRPQQLFLTGDQLYSDDVPAAVLAAATSAGNLLLDWGRPEQLPDGAGGLITDEALLAPGQRSLLLNDQGVKDRPADADLTKWDSDYAANHALFFAEWCVLYLFSWSPELWQLTANVPAAATSGSPFLYYLPPPGDVYPTQVGPVPGATSTVPDTTTPALMYAQSVPFVRRALANVATYMMLDDHDVTDDWFLNAKVVAQERGTPLGRRLMRNALAAYAIFQHWGNDPSAFDTGTPGGTLLSLLDAASGTPRIGQDGGETAADDVLDVGEEPLGVDRRDERMRWDYELLFVQHRVIVIDTRTWRGYPGGHRPVTEAELLATLGQGHAVNADWGPFGLAKVADRWTQVATAVPPTPGAFVAAGADLIADAGVLGSLTQSRAKSFASEANATLAAAAALLDALDAAPGPVRPMQARDWIAEARATLPSSAAGPGDTVADAALRVAALLCGAVFVLREAEATTLSADGSLDDAALAVQTVGDVLEHTAAFLQGAVHSLPRAARHASALAGAWSAVAADSVDALWSPADAEAGGQTLFDAGLAVVPDLAALAASAAEFSAAPDPVAAILTAADRRHAAELISAEALIFQVADRVQDTSRHRPLALVLSPAPVFGNQLHESFSSNAVAYGQDIDPLIQETVDYESWSANDGARTRFLDALAPLGSAVLLSGDVHYSFSYVIDYLAGDGRPARFVQLTSSSAKNASALTEGLARADTLAPHPAPTEMTPLDGIGNLPTQADKDGFEPAAQALVPSSEQAQAAIEAQLDELASVPPDPAMTSLADGFNIPGVGTVLADPGPTGFDSLVQSADAGAQNELGAVAAGADDPVSADVTNRVHAPTLDADRPQALAASVGADPRRLPEIVTTVLADPRIEDRAADSPGLAARLQDGFAEGLARTALLQSDRITVGYTNIGVITTRGSAFGRYVVHEIHWFLFDTPAIALAPDQPAAAFRDDWIITRHCAGLSRGVPADGATVGVCGAGAEPVQEVRFLVDVTSPNQVEAGFSRVHAIVETGPTMPDLTVEVRLTGVTSAADVATARDVRLECTYTEGRRNDRVFVPGPTENNWETLPPGQIIWHPSFADFCGGHLQVFAKATFGGVPVVGSTPVFAHAIFGRNPLKADLRAQAAVGATGPTTNLEVVFDRESSFTQFASSAAALGLYIEGPATVLKSPDRSFGAGQLDTPVPTVPQLWNWQANVDETVRRLRAFRADAITYQGQVQHGDPWDPATGKLNPAPPNEGVSFLDAPAFTTDQLDLEMWARYNSGRRYHDWSPTANAWVRQPSKSTGVTVYAPALLAMRRQVEAGHLPADW